jgi:hypothetical protein
MICTIYKNKGRFISCEKNKIIKNKQTLITSLKSLKNSNHKIYIEDCW